MAGRASRDEDTCMNLTGGTGGAEHFIEEPELVRLQPTTVRFDVADGDISEFELDSPLPINDDVWQYEQTQARAQRDGTLNASATDRLVRAFVRMMFRGRRKVLALLALAQYLSEREAK